MSLEQLKKEFLANKKYKAITSLEQYMEYCKWLEEVVYERTERLRMQRNEIVRLKNGDK